MLRKPLPILAGLVCLWAFVAAGDEDAAAQQEYRQEAAGCEDGDWQCRYWAAVGECDKNPSYMHVVCKSSCRLCPEDSAEDDTWRYSALENHFLPQRLPPILSADFQREMAWKEKHRAPWFTERLYEPRVYILDEFLTDAECEVLKSASVGSEALQHRLDSLARLPSTFREPLQVLNMRGGEEPFVEDSSEALRAAVVILFLSDSTAGGEVILPRLAMSCHGEHFQQCCGAHGSRIPSPVLGGRLTLQPVRRQAVLLYTHDLDGRRNSLGMLGYCPPRAGGEEVWMALQWYRLQVQTDLMGTQANA
mmetsp:Transcript_35370/g.64749  ORF Transcript_35370/g.64749 Transcript_35370/m.64749 type:complete len:306 (-) Transcript_35370:66-983(-)